MCAPRSFLRVAACPSHHPTPAAARHASLCLALLLAAQAPLLSGHPSNYMYSAAFAPTCLSHPARGYGAHGDPRADP
jgi:hypothetical protein